MQTSMNTFCDTNLWYEYFMNNFYDTFFIVRIFYEQVVYETIRSYIETRPQCFFWKENELYQLTHNFNN